MIVSIAKTVKKIKEEAERKNLLIKITSGYPEGTEKKQGCIVIHGGIEPKRFVVIITEHTSTDVITFEQSEKGLSLEGFLNLEGIPYMAPHMPEYENGASMLWDITEELTLDETTVCPDETIAAIVDFLQEPILVHS